MKTKLLAIALAATGILSAASLRRLDGSRIDTAEAEAFAKKTLAEQHVTGAQIAVVNDGKLAWSFVYGRATVEPDQPMRPDMAMWAASITKSIFATYVMHLVETEHFDLDKPIWEDVTPRMFLSHTSGLLNFAQMEPDQKPHTHFKPGTLFNYSGEGFNMVQRHIEEQKHRDLQALMDEAFFRPLGMTHTAMVFRPEFEGRTADRFNRQEKFIAKTRRGPVRAAGSMTSTAEDLAHFTEALFAGRVINPDTMREMLKPVCFIKTKSQFGSKPEDTDGVEGPAAGLAYGTGWGLLTKTKFGPAFFKEGHGDGTENYLICFERSRSCMIVLTNSDNGEMAFRPLFEKILGDTVTPWEWEGYTPATRAPE